MMNSTLVFELVLIQTPMIVKNDLYYERSRSRTRLAKEAGSMDKSKCACKIKINL